MKLPVQLDRRSRLSVAPRSRLAWPLRFMALGLAILSGNLSAQYRAPDAAPDLMRLIRSEKLNTILPQVMRDNGIDMWIHAMAPDDPLGFELGAEPGFVIFTDRDGGRIERAAFGGRRDSALFDVMGGVDEIAAFVAERDPVRIALNYSDIPELDTIPNDHFALIAEAFDEELGERIVSADRLIADFLAGRAMAEIALYGRLLMDNTAIIEEQFDSIVPGETALSDLAGDVYVGNPDINEEHNSDHVIQRGGLVGIFHGAELMDFVQHNGYYGYVLRDGETELPPEILRLWDQAMELRDIFPAQHRRRPDGRGKPRRRRREDRGSRLRSHRGKQLRRDRGFGRDPGLDRLPRSGASGIRRARAPNFGNRLGAGADDTAVPHLRARLRDPHARSGLG